jgi:hypothetical protein
VWVWVRARVVGCVWMCVGGVGYSWVQVVVALLKLAVLVETPRMLTHRTQVGFAMRRKYRILSRVARTQASMQ